MTYRSEHADMIAEIEANEATWERLANAHRGPPRSARRQKVYDTTILALIISWASASTAGAFLLAKSVYDYFAK